MAEINLVIAIRAPLKAVFAAIATVEGLAKWWSSDTQGDAAKQGGIVRFRFGAHGPDMEVTTIVPNSRVGWKCIKHAESASEWIGTNLSFALTEKDGRVHVRFRHADWKEATDFLAFCSMKWATFLLSLRESLENGVGRPYPHDLQIT
jgi:uncharacterized protein YndB with AHSA1/START domain